MDDRTTIANLERRLAESEARHRLLTQTWAQAVWETDANGMVVTDSPSWRAYTGQTLEEWLGYGWLDAIHPDDRAYAEPQWREAVAARRLVDAEFRLCAPDGGWRWTNIRAAPVLDADGTIAKWVGMNIDIDARKHAEVALRQSEERLQLALEATDLAVYEWDLVTDRLQTNERFRKLVGIAPGDLVIGAQVMDYCVHPDDRARVDPDLARATDSASDGRFMFEHRLSRLGTLGHPWVLSHGQVYFARQNDARRPVRVYGTLQDITSRKLAEIAMRESEERQMLLLRLSDALWQLTDPMAEVTQALDLLVNRLGLVRAAYYEIDDDQNGMALIASVETDAVTWPKRMTMSDFGEDISETYRAGHTYTVDEANTDPRLTEQGREAIRDGLGIQRLAGVPLVRSGKLRVVMGVHARDPRKWRDNELRLLKEVAERTWAAIERTRAEWALRQSEERFQQFARASAAGLWIRDADTLEMEFTSPAVATIYGVNTDALLGDVARWASIIVPEDRDAALGHLEAARHGDVAVHEFRIQRPSDGAFHWIRNTNFPLRDDGHVLRIGGIAEDMTEAKLAAEHSAILLAELQHRVRNIMALLRSITNRTGERAESVPDYRDLMTGRLLAFARVQALLTRTANISVGISTIVQDEVSVQAQHEGQYVIDGSDVALSPKAAEVLTLAIHELATNAVKYGALSVPDGKVTVRWSVFEKRGGPWLSFDWSEEGAPERPQPTLDRPRRRGFGSELIERRIPYELRGRGQITIEPGGARCHLEFPLQDGASVLETGAPQRATVFGGAIDMTGEPDLTGLRVLVVEDDYYLATDTARALRGAGAEVMGLCATEEDARAELADQRPDAVVVDINLGPGPSFKLAEHLKDRGIPFVFTTGYDAEVIPAEFEGIERLEKPLQLRQIVGAVAKLTRAA